MNKDYYKILEIDRGASDEEIKRAYRKLAHEYHPDKGGDHTRFKEINEAYQVLGNKERREAYDRFGAAGVNQGTQSPGGGFGGFNWQDVGGNAQGFDFSGFGGGVDLNDIIDVMFGRRQSADPRARAGAHIETVLTVTFEEAAFGAEKKVELERNEVCETCHGSGGEPGSRNKTCDRCTGKGQVTETKRSLFGTIQQTALCMKCRGKGRIPEKVCHTCKGAGLHKRKKELTLKIPPGIENGTTLRITGEGNRGEAGAPAGDLYVTIAVKAHPDFTRVGDSITSNIEIPFTDAALGTRIQVPTLYGPVAIKIPAGTQSGEIFKIKGKGIVSSRTGRPGDHLVTIAVTIPKHLSRREKELLEELREKEE